jgi:hypothetical protein
VPPSGIEIGFMDFPIAIYASYFSSIRAVAKSNQKKRNKKNSVRVSNPDRVVSCR